MSTLTIGLEKGTALYDIALEICRLGTVSEREDTLRRVQQFIAIGVIDYDALHRVAFDLPRCKPMRIEDLPDDPLAVNTLYGYATQSEYAMDVLARGVKAKRSYDALLECVKCVSSVQKTNRFDLGNYVGNAEYSDFTVMGLANLHDKIDRLITRGYSVMCYFTPKHSVKALATMVNYLYKETSYMLDISWFKNPMWRRKQVKAILELENANPHIHYDDIITPRSPVIAIREALEKGITTGKQYTEIRDRWKNMSPKLEYVMMSLISEDADVHEFEEHYESYKALYGCDGESLADMLCKEHGVCLSEELADYQKYFYEDRIPDGAIEWLRANCSDSMKDLPDIELWDVGKDSYYANNTPQPKPSKDIMNGTVALS